MIQTLGNTLKVDVPVGDQLAVSRDILVSIDRVGEAPLSIRLRLIPDLSDDVADLGAMPAYNAHDTPMPLRRRKREPEDYPGDDFGGSD